MPAMTEAQVKDLSDFVNYRISRLCVMVAESRQSCPSAYVEEKAALEAMQEVRWKLNSLTAQP